MIDLKEEIKKELTVITKKKEELKEEILSKNNNEKISYLKVNFSKLLDESKLVSL